jgi:ubiquinone/menaquinone biosynthesis C-methylase UbiE
MATRQPKTSWGKISNWYDKHLKEKDNYHNQVVLPRLAEIVSKLIPKTNTKAVELLDLACGQGGWIEYLTQQPFTKSWNFTGVDLAQPLIKIAQDKSLPRSKFLVAAAETMASQISQKFDLATCVLALQNMQDLDPVFKQLSQLLQPEGYAIFVITHPAFRIPKHSDWVDDPRTNKIYRGSEKYMSQLKLPISSRPFKSEFGKAQTEVTWSFHRPLQDYVNNLAKNSLAVVGMHEWVSHKKSEVANPKAELEDRARQEIPMFMCLVAKKLPNVYLPE